MARNILFFDVYLHVVDMGCFIVTLKMWRL